MVSNAYICDDLFIRVSHLLKCPIYEHLDTLYAQLFMSFHINDLMLKEGLERAEFVLLDINLEAAEKVAQLGRKPNKERGLCCTFEASNDEESAFKDADYVIVTITTGGLNTMEYDLKIPEEYGIYQTVGHRGWARGLRNIPIFANMAKKITS